MPTLQIREPRNSKSYAGAAPSPHGTPSGTQAAFSTLLVCHATGTRRRVISLLVVLYAFAITLFCGLLTRSVQPSQRTYGVVSSPPVARQSNDREPPSRPPPSASLEDAYRAVEEEARRAARQEAPRLEREEAERVQKEAARAKRLAERWENATRDHERVQQKRDERKRNAERKKAKRLKISIEELQSLEERERQHSGQQSSQHSSQHSKHANSSAAETPAVPTEASASKGQITSRRGITTTASSSSGSSSGSSTMGSSSMGNSSVAALSSTAAPLPAVGTSRSAEVDPQVSPSAARCLDGSSAGAFVHIDAASRRKLVKAMATEAVERSQRPFFAHTFFARGLHDQMRFIWYVLLEAEVEGAVAVLPEGGLSDGSASAHSRVHSGGASSEKAGERGSVTASLDSVWDLDLYLLLLRCYTGLVAVRPADVAIELSYGRPMSDGARFDSSELRRRVGSTRLMIRRTQPGGEAEAATRHELVQKLATAAAAVLRGNATVASATAVPTAASPGHVAGPASLAASLAQLALSTEGEPQLAQAIARQPFPCAFAQDGAAQAQHPSPCAFAQGAPTQAAPPRRSPSLSNEESAALATAWFDHLWRTHRRALVPSMAVAAQASLALQRLHLAGTALQTNGVPHHAELLSLKLLHDPKTTATSVTAAAQLLLGRRAPQPLPDATDTADAFDNLDLEQSSDGSSPVRMVEAVHTDELSRRSLSRHDHAHAAKPQLLLLTPFDLPSMPLAVAAAWSKQLPAFSLSMLLQNASDPHHWESALAVALEPLYSPAGISGKERWILHAVELVLHIYADHIFGSADSADFHDVALLRCDAKSRTPSIAPMGAVTAKDLRALYFDDLLYPRNVWADGHPPDPRGVAVGRRMQASGRESLSADSGTSGQRIQCPASSGEMMQLMNSEGAPGVERTGTASMETTSTKTTRRLTEATSASKAEGRGSNKAVPSKGAGGKDAAKQRSTISGRTKGRRKATAAKS